MTAHDRRQFEPTVSDHPDPIDSWSWASLIVGIVLSGAGLIGMVYGAVQFLAR